MSLDQLIRVLKVTRIFYYIKIFFNFIEVFYSIPKTKKSGDDLLSHPGAGIVPLARVGLTSLFGMGRGVSPLL